MSTSPLVLLQGLLELRLHWLPYSKFAINRIKTCSLASYSWSDPCLISTCIKIHFVLCVSNLICHSVCLYIISILNCVFGLEILQILAKVFQLVLEELDVIWGVILLFHNKSLFLLEWLIHVPIGIEVTVHLLGLPQQVGEENLIFWVLDLRWLLSNLNLLYFLELVILLNNSFFVNFVFLNFLLVIVCCEKFQIRDTALSHCCWELWIIVLMPFQVFFDQLLNFEPTPAIRGNRFLMNHGNHRVRIYQ